jgi:hypothetical protein
MSKEFIKEMEIHYKKCDSQYVPRGKFDYSCLNSNLACKPAFSKYYKLMKKEPTKQYCEHKLEETDLLVLK